MPLDFFKKLAKSINSNISDLTEKKTNPSYVSEFTSNLNEINAALNNVRKFLDKLLLTNLKKHL